jgi:Icc-related predicted phosphoesterase
MKLLAFVDLHGEKKAYDNIKKKVKKEKPDFLICAGDFTIFENEIEQMMNRLSKLGKVFLVHGNHEEETVVGKLAKKYKNIDFIHGKVIKYKDIVLVGWGGGGFTIRDVEFEDFVRTIRKDLKRYKKMGRKIILVSHAPFYKTSLDLLGDHHGNKSLRNFIKEFKAEIGICGHFHENAGKEDKIKNCRLYNPGPKGRIITI